MSDHFKVVKVNCESVVDERSFHDVFAPALGFPDFYARTMVGWEHCLSELDNPKTSMTSIKLQPGQLLAIWLVGYSEMLHRVPKLCADINEIVGSLNLRRVSKNGSPIIALAFAASPMVA